MNNNQNIQNLLNTAVQQANQLGQTAQNVLGGTYTAGQNGLVGSYTPTTISSANLTSQAPYTLPQATTPVAANGLQGSIQAQAQQYGQSVIDQNALDQAKAKNSDYQNQIADIFGQLANKGNATEAAYAAEGVDTSKKALTDINNQILAEQNALNHQKDAIYNAPGVTREQANQQFSEVQRQSLSKQADLSVVQYAAQNRYSDAKAIADRKIEMQFEPLQTKLDALKFFYSENKDTLTKAEDRQFQATINERSRLLDEQKTDAKLLQATKLDAIKDAQNAGAPTSVLQAIQSSRTPEEALRAKGGYSLEALSKKAAIDNIYSEIANRGGVAGISKDPSQVIAYAQQYASTGQVPTGLPKGSFGIISQYAKELPKAPGTIVDRNTGVKSSGVSSSVQEGFSILYSVIELAKQLKDLDNQRYHGLVSGTIGKIAGSDTQRQYIDLRAQISDLLARARTGAAINASEEKRYYGLLPSRFSNPLGFGASSQTRIDDFINIITKDLDNKTRSQGLAIYGLSPIKLGGQEYKVGDIITVNGMSGRINPDGSITQLTQ